MYFLVIHSLSHHAQLCSRSLHTELNPRGHIQERVPALWKNWSVTPLCSYFFSMRTMRHSLLWLHCNLVPLDLWILGVKYMVWHLVSLLFNDLWMNKSYVTKEWYLLLSYFLWEEKAVADVGWLHSDWALRDGPFRKKELHFFPFYWIMACVINILLLWPFGVAWEYLEDGSKMYYWT